MSSNRNQNVILNYQQQPGRQVELLKLSGAFTYSESDVRYLFTSSFNPFSGAINNFTASHNIFSQSVNAFTSSINLFSSSITNAFVGFSSSINLFSSSITNQVNGFSSSINAFSSSITGQVNGLNSTFTSSVQLIGDNRYVFTGSATPQNLSGGLAFTGTLVFATDAPTNGGNITAKLGRLILSSSIGSIIFASGTYIGFNYAASSAAVTSHYRANNSFLILSSTIGSQVTISGTTLNITQDASSDGANLVNKSSHLILSSSVGSVVALSSSLDFVNIDKGYHINSRNGPLILSSSTSVLTGVFVSGAMWVSAGDTYPAFRVERTTANTAAAVSVMAVRTTSTGDMTYGQGSSINFEIQDNAGINNRIGSIAILRDSTDNSGILTLYTAISGTQTERLRIDSSGQVGIGATPSNPLLVYKAAFPSNIAYFSNPGDSAANLGPAITCGKTTPAANSDCVWLWLLNGAGGGVATVGYSTATAHAAFYAWSDERLKKNIKPTQINGLEIINKIPLKEFDFIDNKTPHQPLGYVAQDLKEVYPTMISGDESKEMLMVSDSCLVPVLVKAIQEFSVHIDKLNERIKKLEKK